MTQIDLTHKLFCEKKYLSIRELEFAGINNAYSLLTKFKKYIKNYNMTLLSEWDENLSTGKKFKIFWIKHLTK